MPFVYVGIAIFLFFCFILLYYILVRRKAKKVAQSVEFTKEKETQKDISEYNYIDYKVCRKEKIFKEPQDDE